jgi:branched-chain amino acid transport system ATP-binding protein
MKIKALNGVSLEVQRGEIVAMIGNNGAGKTTLMKTISGLLRANQGSISFDGAPIHALEVDQIVRRGISLVPEGRHIFARMTVLENLQMGAYTRKESDLSVDYQRIFTLFPILKNRLKQLAGTLSGGEQQMLAIGRALMSAPQLLMLDEPSMGLAPVVVDQIFETIKDVNKNGTTIFLVEQNAKRALRVSHRAYVIETGAIVMSDRSSLLMDNPRVQAAYLGLG